MRCEVAALAVVIVVLTVEVVDWRVLTLRNRWARPFSVDVQQNHLVAAVLSLDIDDGPLLILR